MDVNRGRRLNIVIVGVGGQGLITAARVLGEATIEGGCKAIVAETHGLSQRGGAVEVHVRLGDVYSPLVPRGEADVVLSFEMIEAARGAPYLRQGGLLLTSDVLMTPPTPGLKPIKRQQIEDALRRAGIRYAVVPAREVAEKVGNYVVENMALLGALLGTGLLDGFVDAGRVRAKVQELPMADKNLAAFEEGLKLGAQLKL
ncbi:MAG: indolepyruvate oxidoreductase subunit beta [Acidilobus sp.]